jgi:hypothetical protein
MAITRDEYQDAGRVSSIASASVRCEVHVAVYIVLEQPSDMAMFAVSFV